MSSRENIASNLMQTFKDVTPVNRRHSIKHVTREPFDFTGLSNAQYPAILIRSAGEDREDGTVGGSMGSRIATIDYELICYVKGAAIDSLRNKLIEVVEETLDVDRLRGGHALDTQVTKIEIDEGSIDPIGGVIITVRVMYEYVRGIT